MNLPRRIIIATWLLLAPTTTAFTAHPARSSRPSHRLYDTSVSDFWSSIAATAISPSETLLTTVSLASVSALVGAANAGLAARESQRQSQMKDKLESQQADLGKFQKSVENLNRLAQVLTATGTLSAAYVLLNIVPLVDQSNKIPSTSPQVLAEKRAAVRSANKPTSTLDDLKISKRLDSVVRDFSPAKASSEQADWIREKEDKMNALLEKKREQLLAESSSDASSAVVKSQTVTIAAGEVKATAPSSSETKASTEVKKEDSTKKEEVKTPAKTDEPKKDEVKSEAKKEEPKKPEAKADAKKEEPKKVEVKAEAKKEEVKSEIKKEDVKPEVKKEEVKAEVKKEDVKPEVKKEEVKAEAKKEEVKADAKKEEVKAEAKKEEVKADAKKEEPKEIKKEESKADAKKDEVKKEDASADVNREALKKEQVKVEAKKEEPKKEEPKATVPTEDNLMGKLMNKMDEVKPKEPETIILPEKKVEEPAIKESQAEKKDTPAAPKKEEPVAENKDIPATEKKETSEQQTVAPVPTKPPQATPERVSVPTPSVEVRKQVVEADPAVSIGPFFKNAMKNVDAVFTGIGRTTSTLARQVTKLLPTDVAKEIEKVNDKDVGILTSVAFLATTVGGFVIAATRDEEPDSKKQKNAKPSGENRSLRNNGKSPSSYNSESADNRVRLGKERIAVSGSSGLGETEMRRHQRNNSNVSVSTGMTSTKPTDSRWMSVAPKEMQPISSSQRTQPGLFAGTGKDSTSTGSGGFRSGESGVQSQSSKLPNASLPNGAASPTDSRWTSVAPKERQPDLSSQTKQASRNEEGIRSNEGKPSEVSPAVTSAQPGTVSEIDAYNNRLKEGMPSPWKSIFRKAADMRSRLKNELSTEMGVTGSTSQLSSRATTAVDTTLSSVDDDIRRNSRSSGLSEITSEAISRGPYPSSTNAVITPYWQSETPEKHGGSAGSELPPLGRESSEKHDGSSGSNMRKSEQEPLPPSPLPPPPRAVDAILLPPGVNARTRVTDSSSRRSESQGEYISTEGERFREEFLVPPESGSQSPSSSSWPYVSGETYTAPPNFGSYVNMVAAAALADFSKNTKYSSSDTLDIIEPDAQYSFPDDSMNGDSRSSAESSNRFGQWNGMESRSGDNEKRNGFGSYLDQISRGDSQKAVNSASSSGSGRSQGSPSAWNATGLSDPDSWDPRDFDPLTQSLSGRAVPKPADDKRQQVSRPAPPNGVSSTQSRQNMASTPPINQSQPSQNRQPPMQRAPSNSQRPQDRNGASQSVPQANQSDRKSTWTPTSNSAPYTNPSTLMPTDVAQLSQAPLQGEPVQRRQERARPERPLPKSDKKATWTPPSNNAPYTNPSTLMPTDVTPVDGESYLGTLSSSSTNTRPRGSYNPFGRPTAANAGSAPSSETAMNNRPRTIIPPAPTRPVNNGQTNPVDANRNAGPFNARSDNRSQPTQRTPEREQAVVPVPRSESSPLPPAVTSRPVEPVREEMVPQRPIVTPPPARRTQSPLVPADLIRPVEPDITSVTRASSGRSDSTTESRNQPSSLPRNGFFPQQTSQATRERNGENASTRTVPIGLSNGENATRSRENASSNEVPSDARRVDSAVGPDQPRTNRTPWISSGSSNEQSDYNPRNFDPRTQSFRETLGPNSRSRQNGLGP